MNDRFDEIKANIRRLRQNVPANIEAPSLEMAEWLIGEVERLRVIEDAAREWQIPSGDLAIGDVVLNLEAALDANPSPE